MGLFDIFKKKKKMNNIEQQVVEPQTIPEAPVQPTAEQIFSSSPQIMQSVQPVEPITEPVQPVPQIVQDPVIIQQQITPVVQEQISIEPTPVVEQNQPVEPVLQEQPTNLEINFKPEEESTLEYETGAVVEEPKPIVEQQIALNVNPDEVFEGALKYPYEENTTTPNIENIIEEPESINASLPVIESAPLVTPQQKIEESITPITIPEVETPMPSNEVEQPVIEKVTEIPNIPIGVQAPVNQTPIEQPIVKTIEPTPINIENIQPVINTPNVIEQVQQVSQPVQLNQPQTPVVQAQPNVVRHTKFCENCGEMIPSPTLLICPNCGADLQK